MTHSIRTNLFIKPLVFLLPLTCMTPVLSKGIPLGSGHLYPGTSMSIGYDTNLLQADSEELDSMFILASVGTTWEFRKDADRFKLFLNSNMGRYVDSSDDDYNNFDLGAVANITETKALKFELNTHYNRGHDPRGSTDRLSGRQPDTWHQTNIGIKAIYGREKSKGRIELKADYTAKHYDAFITDERTEDKGAAHFSGAFFYRITPKIDMVFELSSLNTNYKSPLSANRENTEYKGRVGATWQATKKTSGSFKIGYAHKDFKLESVESFSGVDWEALVLWALNARSNITFTTASNTADSTGFGTYTANQSYAVAWQHKLTRRLTSHFSMSYLASDYENTIREDDVYGINLGLEYALKENINIGFNYEFKDRDSTIESNLYSRNIFSLFVKGSY